MAKRTQSQKKPKPRRCFLTFQDDNEPEISLLSEKRCDRHAAQRRLFKNRIALGKEIAARTKICLDTKFWIYLRDAYLNKPKQQSHVLILEKLIALCESKKAICPLFEPQISELELQINDETRRATALVMEKLSDSVCLFELMELRRRESLHFFSERLSLPLAYELPETVWTKAAFYLGEAYLRTSNPFGRKFERKLSPLASNYMWNNLSVCDLAQFQSQGFKKMIDKDDCERLALETTKGKFEHAKDSDTFDSLYKDGSRVFIDYAYVNIPACNLIAWSKGVDRKTTMPDIHLDLAEGVRGFLCTYPKILTCLSSFDIHTGLYAAIQLDRGRKFKPNDFSDFRHAVGALGYYDYFFTEKSLCHLLTNKPLEYDKKYGCVVMADEDSILKTLDSLFVTNRHPKTSENNCTE